MGRGGGRAGAAGEAAEAQCGVVSKDVTNCLQEQQTLVNPWAAGGGSAGGAGGTRGATAECPGAVPPLPPPRLHGPGRVTAPTLPQRGCWDTSTSQLVTVGSPLVPWALWVCQHLGKQEHKGKCCARVTSIRSRLHPWSPAPLATSIPGHFLHLHPWPPLPISIPRTVPTGTPSERGGTQRSTQHPQQGHHPPNSQHTPHLSTAPSSREKDTWPHGDAWAQGMSTHPAPGAFGQGWQRLRQRGRDRNGFSTS